MKIHFDYRNIPFAIIEDTINEIYAIVKNDYNDIEVNSEIMLYLSVLNYNSNSFCLDDVITCGEEWNIKPDSWLCNPLSLELKFNCRNVHAKLVREALELFYTSFNDKNESVEIQNVNLYLNFRKNNKYCIKLNDWYVKKDKIQKSINKRFIFSITTNDNDTANIYIILPENDKR